MTLETESLFEAEPVNPSTMRTEIIHGDCLQVMKSMGPDTYTAVCTDPPAGISFMGKAWDHDKGGRKQWIAWMTEVAAECLRVCKPGAHALVWALPRTAHWTATAWEDAGWEVRDVVDFVHGVGFPKALAVDKAIDKKAGAKREVVRKSTSNQMALKPGVSTYVGKFQERPEAPYVTAPATPDAKTWAGYASALKPAHEDWILLRKPLDGTIAENCVKHGCGALAIDGSRVGTDTVMQHQKDMTPYHGNKLGAAHTHTTGITTTTSGRWPANLCHDSSPEVLAEFAKAVVSSSPARFFASCPAESGDYPPFWYGAKACRREKEKGLEGEEKKDLMYTQDEWTRTHMKSEATQSRNPSTNGHPTVKSLSLMRWLLGLVKMPSDNLILDCFAGTGTTLIAANQLGMDAIGIEQDEEYVRIANLRMKAYT